MPRVGTFRRISRRYATLLKFVRMFFRGGEFFLIQMAPALYRSCQVRLIYTDIITSPQIAMKTQL